MVLSHPQARQMLHLVLQMWGQLGGEGAHDQGLERMLVELVQRVGTVCSNDKDEDG